MMTVQERFPLLFSPLRLRGQVLRNRIVRLPTNSVMAERNRPTEAMTAHYARIAAGGVGTIVTEGFAIHPANTRGPRLVALFDRGAVSSLRQFASSVQAQGAVIIAQMNFGGRQHHSVRDLPLLWAPSSVACPYSAGVPHAMTIEEIEDVIAHFASSAANAREAGFNGVEIHGAQGYLLQQFVSPLSNQRDDEYGGNFENRMRFLHRVVAAVRVAVGEEFIVGFRLGTEEFVAGGLTLEDGGRIAAALAQRGGLDYLSLSQGNFASIEQHLPDRHFPEGAFVAAQASVKKAVPGLPTVASGRITRPVQAEEILATGAADLIGLSRALTADPDWPLKARAGRDDDIRPCIACNECWGAITAGERLRCTVNPKLGQETISDPRPLSVGREVVVIGAGPSGLQAALDAAVRGASVTLLERSQSLGGKLHVAASMPHQAELGEFVSWLVRQVVAAGVEVRTGVSDTLSAVRERRPDEVLLATGATGVPSPVPSDGSVLAWTEPDLELPISSGRLLVLDEDGHNWALATCEALAQRGFSVTMATRFFEPLRALPSVSRIAGLRALHRASVRWISNAEAVRITEGEVVLRDHVTGREEGHPADGAIWIGHQRPRDELGEAIRRENIPVTVVGDAIAPRRLRDAIGDGRRAAQALRTGPTLRAEAQAI